LLDAIYAIFLYPIIYILPAYVANGAPVLSKGRWRGKWPLDFGRKINGKRIFGKNKSIPGTLLSLAAGLIIGLIEYPFLPYMLAIAVMLAIGANAGDLAGSFIKRMSGVASGRSIPILDQYGFLVGAFAFALPLGMLPSLYGIIFIVVLTGVLHVLTNRGAYRLKLKEVPW
jgi:CDP-2,3-bis-(O-geranylgeranyl)-sn-glycerol synthase